MNLRLGIFLALFVALASGCATPPQQPVSLSNDVIAGKSGRIGVTTNKIPPADTRFPGAGCLLCLATAALANTSLTSHAQTLPFDEITLLKKDFVERLKGKGLDAVEIADDLNIAELPDFSASGPNVARKNFTGLRAKYGIDKMLVVDVTTLGFVRNYSAYIPTGDPKAVLTGAGYIVNLDKNTYEWYRPLEVTKAATGKWDEPPKFPGLTNAYFQTIEMARETLLKPFGSSSAQNSQQPAISQSSLPSGNR